MTRNKIEFSFKIFSFFCLWALSACTTIAPLITPDKVFDDFVIVKAKHKDTFSSLAAEYLNDPSKDWVIAQFNDIETLSPGKELIIPLKPFNQGGLTAQGYQTVPILVYHNFSEKPGGSLTVTESAFEKQMSFLKNNGYRVITLEQFIDFLNFKAQIPKKSLVITIDDGWRSVYNIAFPILKKHGFPATLFIYTDFIGGNRALTWEQIKELSENGFDIQCHSKTHRSLTKLKEEESFDEYFKAVNAELIESQKIIKKKLNKECDYLAYPYGEFNKLVIALVKKLGYRGAFILKRQANPFFIDKYLIGRSMVYGKYDLNEFKKNLSVFKKEKLK